jgi:hypothetical protein
MKQVNLVVPPAECVPLADVLTRLRAARPSLPFSDDVLDLFGGLSTAIFRDAEAREYPELQALAFWMRKSQLLRLRETFREMGSDETVLSPRGLVFHIPPANVDTIFVYSWVLSALTGNVNAIRLSDRAASQVGILCRLIAVALQASEALRDSIMVVRYGHDDEITAALSGIADTRVIWGGDSTVELIRRLPLPPHATELTFPDRTSLSVLSAASYLELDDDGVRDLAGKFYNDAYWFDQVACSSPRLIVWCGIPDAVASAGVRFADKLAEHVDSRHYSPPDAVRLARLTSACRAILEAPVEACELRPELSLLTLGRPGELPAVHCGGGFFFQTRVGGLRELTTFLGRRDQTLSYFGFAHEELRALAVAFRGTAVDRIVPIGQALDFQRFWDGFDLLREFTRTVHVKRAPANG